MDEQDRTSFLDQQDDEFDDDAPAPRDDDARDEEPFEGDAFAVEDEPFAEEPFAEEPAPPRGLDVDVEEEEAAAPEAEPFEGESPEEARIRRRGGPPPRQQILVRRLIAVGVGVVFLFLFILGFRACLDSRHERALKDYVRDVTQITGETKQVSDELFGLLENPKSLTPLDYESEIKSHRGAVETLTSRAEGLDAPGGMGKAKSALVTSMELRRDGLTTIADEVSTALGKEGRQEATQKIADSMQAFLASDAVYARLSATEMFNTLRKEGVGGVAIPQSKFLPSLDWLELATVQEALGRVSGGAAATPGVHGVGLVSASIGDTALEEDAPNTVGASGTPELTVEVQNQGEAEETDISVTVAISGGASPIDLDRPISRIGPGETGTVTIPISPRPPAGRELTINVEVAPVPGEQVQDNNRASYTVTFS
jgi:hypothetical protein